MNDASPLNTTWANPEKHAETAPLIVTEAMPFNYVPTFTKYTAVQLPPTRVQLSYEPHYFVLGLCVYLLVIACLSSGQQHMDYGINISAWTVVTTFSQFFATISCAYYWKKLKGNTSHPVRSEILFFSTAGAVFLFKLSLDVYFIQAYASLYDTQTGLNSFAQRQFDLVFSLINVSCVTLLPYGVFFLTQHWRRSKGD